MYIAVGVSVYFVWKGQASIVLIPLVWCVGWILVLSFNWLDRLLGYGLPKAVSSELQNLSAPSIFNEGTRAKGAQENDKVYSDQAEPKASIELPMRLIFLQLPLCELEPLSLAKRLWSDDFGLGYVFGMADMANYQFNANRSNQSASLSSIRTVFAETLGGDGNRLFARALENQHMPKFAEGRRVGAGDLGEWVKSQGKASPLGLAKHFKS